MEYNLLKMKCASFTVEAVFVMTFTVWIFISICYFSLYSHDSAIIGSLGHNYIELQIEDKGEIKENELEIGLKKYIQGQLFICKIEDISIHKKVLALDMDIHYRVDIRFPFAKELMTGKEGKAIHLSHELMVPAYVLWDSEAIKKVYGQGGKNED